MKTNKSLTLLLSVLLLLSLSMNFYHIIARIAHENRQIEQSHPLEKGYLQFANAEWFLQPAVWGDAEDGDVLAVLQMAADIFADRYGSEYIHRHEKPLKVEKNPLGNGFSTGEIDLSAIYLGISAHYWDYYICHFAHELYHYLMGRFESGKRHLWFDEMLAEVHSLYVLNEIAENWESISPHKSWIHKQRKIENRYRSKVFLNDTGIRGSELADLFKDKREILENNATVEWNHKTGELEDSVGINRFVYSLSHTLYHDVFKNNSKVWEAMKVFGEMGYNEDLTFEELLSEWYSRCEKDAKPVVQSIASIFEIEL
jgi:hypothetical protein